MSVPLFDVQVLWLKPCDEFNEWRATTDLPLLYDYFMHRLPGFGEWATEFDIDGSTFCHTIPTGKLLIGDSVVTLVRYSVERTSYYKYLPLEIEAKEYARRCKANGHPVDELKELTPYLRWGTDRFGTSAFIPNENTRARGIIYNSWSAVNLPTFSRASIFRNFEVLKLGGLCVTTMVSGRNLDFADLDYLTIQGEYNANKQTFIHYSSCRDLTIDNARMAFYHFYQCPLNEFRCVSSKLYSFNFVQCDAAELRFEDSELRKIQFNNSGASFNFDRCDLIDVEYTPPQRTRFYSQLAEIYRQFRIAYQSTGKRHEAAQAYLQERTYERKSFFDPYLELADAFPSMRSRESFVEIMEEWKGNTYSSRVAARHLRQALYSHLQVWTHPRHALRALRLKLRYFMSLGESIVWGYGERPSRIVGTALSLLFAYTLVYHLLLNTERAVPSTSLLDCAYLSIVTFTTLGYGDITPKTDLMKIACGSEAAVGAFVIGLVVAGFANKSRY